MQKQLEWSIRAERDPEGILDHFAETASPFIARVARDVITDAARRIAGRALL